MEGRKEGGGVVVMEAGNYAAMAEEGFGATKKVSPHNDEEVAEVRKKEEEEETEVVELEGWSTRVEDLVDNDDEDGAVKLLESVIAKLSVSKDAQYNLGLAAAMNDLAGLYTSQGLSLKADALLSDSLLIKKSVEQAPQPRDSSSWEDAVEDIVSTKPGGKQLKHIGKLQEGAKDHDRTQNVGNATTAGLSDEEDWEAAVPTLLATPPVFSPVVKKPETAKETGKQKQRGRGSFTYGGGGLYSDNVEDEATRNERLDQANTGGANDHWDGGAEHVLLIDGFTPMMKTKDLEDLVRPYSSQGVAIRWVDDTTVLAVFRTPALARQALSGISDPRFRLHKYCDANAAVGHSVSLSVTDLEPPAPRPATNARVAQRMIAGALSRQGVSHNLRAKTRVNAEQALIQEAERKQRLHNRQQLRDEAWGDD